MPKKTKKRPPATPQVGIRELVWVDPTSLDDNPLNWRKHPPKQRSAIGASIKNNGWADALKFNENTGNLIDGHGRKQVAIENGIDSVPVLIGWWSEDQEKDLLATLDPLGSMAETDAEALQALTKSLKQDEDRLENLADEEARVLETFTHQLDSYAFDVGIGNAPASFLNRQKIVSDREQEEILDPARREVEYDESVVTYEVNEDVFFEGYGDIPALDPEGIATQPPTITWDRQDKTNVPEAWYCYSARPFPEDRVGGTLGFFTEDHRFEKVWQRKKEFVKILVEDEWDSVVAPDFSTWSSWPFPVRLYNVYRSRWCARFWQEFGIKVIPTLPWGGDPEENAPFMYESLPENCPLVATQCRVTKGDRKAWASFARAMHVANECIQPQGVIIYGGIELREKFIRNLPKGPEYIFLDAFMTKRRHRLKRS